MKYANRSPLALAVAVAVLAACGESTTPSLLNDDTITDDIASSSGDAIASSIAAMMVNEGDASLPGSTSNVASLTSNSLTYDRTRVCYDANGAVVQGCSPISSVRKVATHVEIDGTRSGSHTTRRGTTASWTGIVHRVWDDTVTRNFNTAQPPVETSRTHGGVMAGSDTTTVSEGDFTRQVAETSRDTIKAVTWNLPRSSNPFPVSGAIVRVDSVHITVTKGSRTETREVVRKLQVDFPADAQGNVVLKINDKTCNLNLVTHVVSNCQ